MSQASETFFTIIGCMDGRCQEVITEFGRKKFGALYPDTITEPGLVGVLANKPAEEFLDSLKKKIVISLEKHHSKGIIIDGHAECAGDVVDDETHKDHILKSVEVIKSLLHPSVSVVGVFVYRCHEDQSKWKAEEVSLPAYAA